MANRKKPPGNENGQLIDFKSRYLDNTLASLERQAAKKGRAFVALDRLLQASFRLRRLEAN